MLVARRQANRVKEKVMSSWNKVSESGEPKEEREPKEMSTAGVVTLAVVMDENQSVAAGG
jgi:hypothetical protein